MSLDTQIQNKALAQANLQATVISGQIAADLVKYQSTLVNQFAAIGVTLATPMSFTQQSVILAWLLPQLQSILTAGFLNASIANISAAGFSQPSSS